LRINFIFKQSKKNDMTNLEFNAKVFLMENEDLFFDIYLKTNSKSIIKILEDENLFFRLCAYLQKGNLLDFAYLQKCFNDSLIEFKRDMQQYFA
jgi:hypothetical protein